MMNMGPGEAPKKPRRRTARCHYCAKSDCRCLINFDQLFCTKHWNQLPRLLQLHIKMEWNLSKTKSEQSETWLNLAAEAVAVLEVVNSCTGTGGRTA